MTEERNSRPLVAQETGQTETAAFGEAAASYNYSTTQKSECQISDYLLSGEENATPLRHLVSLLGIDGRTVRRMIMSERLKGIPILSNNLTGYYLSKNEEEKKRFIASMKNRSKEIFRVATAVERGGQRKS